MSVMACDRNGCDSVCCDSYSSTFGYICYNCKNELIETRGSRTIGEFMKTRKMEHTRDESYAWSSYVERIFERDEE